MKWKDLEQFQRDFALQFLRDAANAKRADMGPRQAEALEAAASELESPTWAEDESTPLPGEIVR